MSPGDEMSKPNRWMTKSGMATLDSKCEKTESNVLSIKSFIKICNVVLSHSSNYNNADLVNLNQILNLYNYVTYQKINYLHVFDHKFVK